MKDYIPPRKSSTNLVNLQKEEKYDLVEPEIPPGVIVEGDMLGAIPSLKFTDHDLSDEKKFPDLAPRKYLKTFIDPETSFIRVEPKTWATGLEKSGILNLLQIPHFGRSVEINACVKMLLRCIHGDIYGWTELCPLTQN
jgi:hypothetical protein